MFAQRLTLLLGLLILAGFVLCPAAMAWNLPDDVSVQNSQPPKVWVKAGGQNQSGVYSLQRYTLHTVTGATENMFRTALVWPKAASELFCVYVWRPNIEHGVLPKDCSKGLTAQGVFTEVYNTLKDPNSMN